MSIYDEIKQSIGLGKLSTLSKEKLVDYSAALARPQAYAHFGASEFPQVCETIRTLLIVRSNDGESTNMLNSHYKVLRLASNGKLPEGIDETSEFKIDVVTELIEAGYLKAIDASDFDGTAYLQTKITLSGREYLDELRNKFKERQNKMATNKTKYAYL